MSWSFSLNIDILEGSSKASWIQSIFELMFTTVQLTSLTSYVLLSLSLIEIEDLLNCLNSLDLSLPKRETLKESVSIPVLLTSFRVTPRYYLFFTWLFREEVLNLFTMTLIVYSLDFCLRWTSVNFTTTKWSPTALSSIGFISSLF